MIHSATAFMIDQALEGEMPRSTQISVVMLSELEDERVRGLQYGRDGWRFSPAEGGDALFEGDRGTHSLTWDGNGNWRCTCRAFRRLGQVAECRHTIAAKAILRRLAWCADSVATTR